MLSLTYLRIILLTLSRFRPISTNTALDDTAKARPLNTNATPLATSLKRKHAATTSGGGHIFMPELSSRQQALCEENADCGCLTNDQKKPRAVV